MTRCVVLLWHASTLADKPPDHRQCLFDAQAAFGDRFISRVEFHEADVTQTRSEHDVRRPPANARVMWSCIMLIEFASTSK